MAGAEIHLKNYLNCGRESLPSDPRVLHAGPLSMLFETETGFLRRIRLGEIEVLRAIYGAVRDQNWGTVAPEFSEVHIDAASDSFKVRFEACCRNAEIDFSWKGVITGLPDGSISFEFNGEANTRFLRNRIGLCVLHPIRECAGKACRIERITGTRIEGFFPREISPHQPFTEIRAIGHEVMAGISATVKFEGETFEMEDQRNWTDASFKTYGTPLAIPVPQQVEAGAVIRQRVTLVLNASPENDAPAITAGSQTPSPAGSLASAREIVISLPAAPNATTGNTQPLPPLGVCLHSDPHGLSPLESERLRLLQLSQLRVDLHLSDPGWRDAWARGIAAAQTIRTRLHVALFVTHNAEREMADLATVAQSTRPGAMVALWLIFHETEKATSEQWLQIAKEHLVRAGENSPVAAGSNIYFAELNRNRPPWNSVAMPSYPINPQVHAFDNLTLIENLDGQAATVETAASFSPQPVVISPVTLRPRPKSITRPASDPAPDAPLPSDVDVRQMSPFAAGWTLGSIARLAATGRVHSLTYYETAGNKGLMEREWDLRTSSRFPAQPGALFPVYHLFAALRGFDLAGPAPADSEAITTLTLISASGRRRFIAANVTSDIVTIRIATGACQVRCRFLDERNAARAADDPACFSEQGNEASEKITSRLNLQLLPFALVCADLFPD